MSNRSYPEIVLVIKTGWTFVEALLPGGKIVKWEMDTFRCMYEVVSAIS